MSDTYSVKKSDFLFGANPKKNSEAETDNSYNARILEFEKKKKAEITKKVEEAAKKLKGNAKKIAVALDKELKANTAFKNYVTKNIYVKDELKKFDTIDDLLENGLSEFFEFVIGKEEADIYAQMIRKLGQSTYDGSYYRRGHRSSKLLPYLVNVYLFIENIFGRDTSTESLIEEFKNQRNNYYISFYTRLTAVKIDNNDKELISFLEETMLSETNTVSISRKMIEAILSCDNEKLLDLLFKVVDAAKLQEGFRQSFFESADFATINNMKRILKFISDNNMIRFSSVLRAVCVWFGLGYNFEDKRQVEKIVTLAHEYLTDNKKLKKAANSKDVLEMFVAMWCETYSDIENLHPYIEKYMKGKDYQKHLAFYFIKTFNNQDIENDYVIPFITKDDFEKEEKDTALIAMGMFKLGEIHYGYYRREKKDFKDICKEITILKDKKLRKKLFDSLVYTAEKIGNETSFNISGKPFPWTFNIFSARILYSNLQHVIGYGNDAKELEKLMELIIKFYPEGASAVLDRLIDPKRSQKERDFVFDCVKNRSKDTKNKALKMIKTLEISDNDAQKLINLMQLKDPETRWNVRDIFCNLEKESVFNILDSLFSVKSTEKRLGGLDILMNLYKQEKVTLNEAKEKIAMIKSPAKQEKVVIDSIINYDKETDYSFENGFQLYNPKNAELDFKFTDKGDLKTITEFKNVSALEMAKAFTNLVKLVEENKDYKFTIELYGGEKVEQVFGEVERDWYLNLSKKDTDNSLSNVALGDVWEKWYKDNIKNFGVFYKLNYAFNFLIKDSFDVEQEDWATTRFGEIYEPWVIDYLRDNFGIDEAISFNNFLNNKNFKFLNLAKIVFKKVFNHLDSEDEKFFEYRYKLSLDMYELFPQDKWQEFTTIKSESRWSSKEGKYVDRKKTFLENNALSFAFVTSRYNSNDKLFGKVLKFTKHVNDLSGLEFSIPIWILVKAVRLKLAKKDSVYHYMFSKERARYYYGRYSSKDTKYIERNSRSGELLYHEKDIELLHEIEKEVNQRVIDIEVKRGDSKTEVSDIVSYCVRHYGVENFAKILLALGEEKFIRGYSFNLGAKKDNLSLLLTLSVPNENDTHKDLLKLLDGKFPEKRLVEVANYVPAWVDIIEKAVAWKGLKSGIWYFRAHTSENISAESESELAKYTPISNNDFVRGAFDVEWFKDVYKTLKPERFDILYDAAKYSSSGSTHRRAQLYADAVLGKLKKKDLEKEISDKRNKDKLMAYSLIGFEKDKMKDALKRYEFIQNFIKESKKFGAQRKESERNASEIALDNLARNLGFEDVLRFAWKMETLKAESMQIYFKPKKIDEYEFTFEISEIGEGLINIKNTKTGKVVKSVPSKYKKNEYVCELTELRKSLREQLRRGRLSFESAMEKQSTFTHKEVLELLEHPVIKNIVEKLVFKHDKGLGFLNKSGLIKANGETVKLKATDKLTVAHSFDLLKSGEWSDFQKYAFENSLIQPFKQIFREVYVINKDEISAKTISRRYAGHQVQPKKTVALLKTRGWKVDYEEGLQKVYFNENIIVKMYAVADWFSPSDVEAPTLETVEFFDRKTYKNLDLEKINPVIFSEVMRDVDLVVSVAHVGGVDPESSHSTIEMRGMIVTESAKLMKLKNVKVDKNHVHIKGKYGEYSVHLGSGMAHKMGKGAVNILAVHSQHRGKIFLPFLDEDPKTSEIVSKVLFLAEDTKIKDPSILEQIK